MYARNNYWRDQLTNMYAADKLKRNISKIRKAVAFEIKICQGNNNNNRYDIFSPRKHFVTTKRDIVFSHQAWKQALLMKEVSAVGVC